MQKGSRGLFSTCDLHLWCRGCCLDTEYISVVKVGTVTRQPLTLGLNRILTPPPPPPLRQEARSRESVPVWPLDFTSVATKLAMTMRQDAEVCKLLTQEIQTSVLG